MRGRRKVLGTAERPRLSVHFSLRYVYAQVIDDTTGRVLASATSLGKDWDAGSSRKTVDAAKAVGTKVAEAARAASIEDVVFDRSGYAYHGRVKALADAAREAGLRF